MEDHFEGFRLSPQQRRLWLVNQGGAPYRAQCSVLLHGALSRDRLRQALIEVVARHEILATKFRKAPAIKTPLQGVMGNPDVVWQEVELSSTSAVASPRLVELKEQELQVVLDLEEGPVVRALLAGLGVEHHALVLTLPSLCADAASLGHLVAEIVATYDGGYGEGDDEETVQYVQFSEWQHGLMEAEEAPGGRAHWQRLLAEAPAAIKLPVEGVADSSAPFRPTFHALKIAPETAAALGQMAEDDQGANVLFACWRALLARLTDHAEFALLAVFDNRQEEGLEDLLGPLARTVPVRCRPERGESLQQAVVHAAAELDEADEWQSFFVAGEDWPLEDPSSAVAGAIGFACISWAEAPPVSGLRLTLDSLFWCAEPLKLELFCVRTAASDSPWQIGLQYDAAALTPEAVARLGGWFENLLAAAVRDPERSLDRLRILGDDERHFLLEELNRTESDHPRDRLLHQLFEEQVNRVPQEVAGSFEGTTLSYAELDARANDLAHELMRRGVGPDVLVGLFLPRSLDLLVTVLGVLKAGGAYLPLDVEQPRERLGLILRDGSPRVVLTTQALRESLPSTAAQVVVYEGASSASGRAAPEVHTTPENLAYVCYTSGSTGRPKGVMVHHRGLVNYLSWCRETYETSRGTGTVVHSLLGFDLTVTSFFSALLAGHTVHLLRDQPGIDALGEALMEHHDLSLVKVTPAHLEVLAQALNEEALEGRARVLILGGEALFSEPLAGWRRHAPATRLINEYGPTETVVGCCAYEVPAQGDLRGAIPIGRPIANARVYVLDPHLAPVPIGLSGELWVGGDPVTRGYLRRPAWTAERFVPDALSQTPGSRVYRTGDLVRVLPSGDLSFVGRVDQQLKIRGFRIEPGEIETTLLSHQEVQEAVVTAYGQESTGRQLAAYLVARETTVDPEDMRLFLANKLPEYMIPSAYVWLPALPLTAQGKVDRQKLPVPGSERPDLKEAYQAPRNVLEEALAEIWAEALRLERVGIDDNFFALGGDSIRSVRVVALARERGLDFDVQRLFQYPTVRALTAALESAVDLAVGENAEEDVAELLSQLDGLSEEEIGEQLREKMLLADAEEAP